MKRPSYQSWDTGQNAFMALLYCLTILLGNGREGFGGSGHPVDRTLSDCHATPCPLLRIDLARHSLGAFSSKMHGAFSTHTMLLE